MPFWFATKFKQDLEELGNFSALITIMSDPIWYCSGKPFQEALCQFQSFFVTILSWIISNLESMALLTEVILWVVLLPSLLWMFSWNKKWAKILQDLEKSLKKISVKSFREVKLNKSAAKVCSLGLNSIPINLLTNSLKRCFMKESSPNQLKKMLSDSHLLW